MQRLGARHADRIATLAWNDFRHLEIYYAVSGSGFVCHTLNPRLFEEQIVYIVNHAEDRWLFLDPAFVPLVEKLQDRLPHVEGYIVLCDDAHMPATRLPGACSYESLIAPESSDAAARGAACEAGSLCPLGYMQITDRKDVIKSGGEWISSIEPENLAASHPAIAQAAVIAIAHPKWQERPLLVAVLKPGAIATREQVLEFFSGKVAKWWIPDDVVFVDRLPHTATGKLSELRLRQEFGSFRSRGT